MAFGTACGRGSPTSSSETTGQTGEVNVTDEDSVAAAAAAARMGPYNGFASGGQFFPLINVVARYGTTGSSGIVRATSTSPAIAMEVRAAVEAALAPSKVVWVDTVEAVLGTGRTIPDSRDVGAVLTLARPEISGASARIDTAMWCGSLCGTGGRFVLHKTNGVWSVTGTEGPSWIS